MTVSIPQPISTPTKLGITLSVIVIVVPIVHPAPECTSGIIRILLPVINSWLHNVFICSTASFSITFVKTLAVLYFPVIS